MIWLVLVLVAVAGIGYMVWRHSDSPSPPEVDAEQAVKAAIELHRIRRNFDVSWTKSQQRREGAALRREIAEILKAEGDG